MHVRWRQAPSCNSTPGPFPPLPTQLRLHTRPLPTPGHPVPCLTCTRRAARWSECSCLSAASAPGRSWRGRRCRCSARRTALPTRSCIGEAAGGQGSLGRAGRWGGWAAPTPPATVQCVLLHSPNAASQHLYMFLHDAGVARLAARHVRAVPPLALVPPRVLHRLSGPGVLQGGGR